MWSGQSACLQFSLSSFSMFFIVCSRVAMFGERGGGIKFMAYPAYRTCRECSIFSVQLLTTIAYLQPFPFVFFCWYEYEGFIESSRLLCRHVVTSTVAPLLIAKGKGGTQRDQAQSHLYGRYIQIFRNLRFSEWCPDVEKRISPSCPMFVYDSDTLNDAINYYRYLNMSERMSLWVTTNFERRAAMFSVFCMLTITSSRNWFGL